MNFQKNKIWAVVGQIMFAMFIIVAIYAFGFTSQITQARGMVPATLHNAHNAVKDIGGTSSISYETIYGLTVSAIVFAFVGIIMPVVSMFLKKEHLNFAAGWTAIIYDIVSVVLMTAAISLWAKQLTVNGHPGYNKGFLSGQFLFTYVGAILGFTALGITYKKDLLKWA